MTLKHSVVLGRQGGDLEVELPGLLVPDHLVAREAGQLPLHAQPKPVLSPLQHPPLIRNDTRQHDLQEKTGFDYVEFVALVSSTKLHLVNTNTYV